jgi:hypothetical protein
VDDAGTFPMPFIVCMTHAEWPDISEYRVRKSACSNFEKRVWGSLYCMEFHIVWIELMAPFHVLDSTANFPISRTSSGKLATMYISFLQALATHVWL